MDRLTAFISMIDRSLNTRNKRHIAGGILISVSMLFTGLAITVFTIKNENEEYTTENSNEFEHLYSD